MRGSVMQIERTRSAAQNERQQNEYRNKGRYSKVNPCYYCGRSAGVDYFSLEPFVGIYGESDCGLVLCKKCIDYLLIFTIDRQRELLLLSAYGTNPQKRVIKCK